MSEIYIQSKRGINASALLRALINLGVDRFWLTEELRKLYPFVEVEEVNGSTCIKLKSAEKVTLTGQEIPELLDKSALSESVKHSVRKIAAAVEAANNKFIERDDNSSRSQELNLTVLYAASFMLCLQALGCKKVYSAPLEVDSNADNKVLDIVKGTKIKIVDGADFSYDYCAAAFISIIGEYKSVAEGIVVEVSGSEVEGSSIRAVLLEGGSGCEEDVQYIVECNIDDMNSEGYDYIFNKLLTAGALDVYMTPIIMKKGRPAVKLSVLAAKEELGTIKECIFKETSTFGVRSYAVEKTMLERSFGRITVFGEKVGVKYGYLNGKLIKYKPEYEDCRKIAQEKEIGINRVYVEALRNIPSV